MYLGLLLVLAMVADPAAQGAAPAAEPKEKLICRREVPIGSLIASRKICLTKSEWERRIRDGNEEARNQAYNNMGRPSCNDTNTC